MEHIAEIVGTVAGAIVVAVFTAFVIGWKKRVDKSLIEVMNESSKIKENYLQRFDDLKALISSTAIANVRELNGMEKRLTENLNEKFVEEKLCILRHENMLATVKELTINKP